MNDKKHAFALVMVLMVIAISAVLGVTYLSAASLKRISSKNMVSVARARYLAESALQHAIYLCQNKPDQLVNTSAASMLGPYYADATSDSYKFYGLADPLVAGQWTLYGVGYCGNISQTVSAVAFRTGGTSWTRSQSMMSAGSITLPGSVRITGDMTVNGSVTNKGYVDGLISYSSSYTAGGGTATRTPVKVVNPAIPSLDWTAYKQYKLYSRTYNGQQYSNSYLLPGSVPNNNCVTAANPAGVLYVNGSVIINDNFTFKGTLSVNGSVYINGSGISLTTVPGFPALVVTGRIYIVDYSNMTVDGVVYVAQGISPYLLTASNSHTKITGGYVSATRGYDSTLYGLHELIYTASRCKLYDATGATSDAASAQVQITKWND